MRISDGEKKVMKLVWESEGITAKELAAKAQQKYLWSRTTTYTMISVCIGKNYLRREDPHFHCYSLISQEDASIQEAEDLLDNSFGGSADLLIAALVSRKRLSKDQLERLTKLLETMKEK